MHTCLKSIRGPDHDNFQAPAIFTMQLQLPGSIIPVTVSTIAAIVAATIVISLALISRPQLDAIPTVGSSGWLGSWWAARKFTSDDHLFIQEGYRKYKALPFKVADTWRWVAQHIEELRKAPDDALSFNRAMNDTTKLEYTLGREIMHNPYHQEVIRGSFTRNLGSLYPEIRDEISVAFDEILDLGNNEWKTVSALSIMQKVVCGVSNRIFVGLPLCTRFKETRLVLAV